MMIAIAFLMRARIVVIGVIMRAGKIVTMIGILVLSRVFVVHTPVLMLHELVTVELVWILVFALVLRIGEWVGIGIGIRHRARRARRSRRSLRPWRSKHRRWRTRRGTGLSGRRTGGCCLRARARRITRPKDLRGSTRGSTKGGDGGRNLRRASQISAKRGNIPSVREVVVAVRDAERGTVLDDGVRDTARVERNGSGKGRRVHEGEQKNETSVDGHIVDCGYKRVEGTMS
jgi:hypothetical protein